LPALPVYYSFSRLAGGGYNPLTKMKRIGSLQIVGRKAVCAIEEEIIGR
jgi:hypothetical protein